MNLKHLLNVIIFLTIIQNVVSFIDPISIAVGSGILSGIYYYRNPIKQYTICKAFECCDEQHIPGKFSELKYVLENKLYGQHLVQQVVVDALISHFKEKNPQKALTLSFHGGAGCGKNYVTKFIKEAMFKNGERSQYIHHFTARIHFPLEHKVHEYQANLLDWIKGNVTNCERSLFIFDEVDKMPENVLNIIKPLVDYSGYMDKVNFKKAVFIFLSNTGATIIKDHYLTLWEKGVKREDITLTDFEHLITKGAFNEKGGFHHSDTIRSNLIDHYIPFLPMEKEHVELCIRDQFKLRGVYYPTIDYINEIMETVTWGPEPANLFSTTGCKRISQKVPLLIQRYNLRKEL